jgi:hypothetical protein
MGETADVRRVTGVAHTSGVFCAPADSRASTWGTHAPVPLLASRS